MRSGRTAPAARWRFPLLLASVLSACSTPTPLQRPTGDIASTWPTAAAGPTASGGDAGPVRWQTFFTDPRLQALIAMALDNNRDLRIAAARVDQERAMVRIARADTLPTVNLQVDETRSYTPSAFNTGASTRRIDVQGLLSYELDFWGRVASMSASARAAYLATEHARREVYLSLVSEVARAYHAVLEQGELIELGQSTVQSREQTLAVAVQGIAAGGASEDEREQAVVNLEAARSALAQSRHRLDVANNQLVVLVGRVIGDLPPGRPLADQEPGVVLAAGVPSETLLRRPDVMAAEQRLIAANADIDAARAAYLPKIMLTAALGLASPALATLLSSGAWSYSPVLTLPIFDGGRTAGGAEAAQARQAVAVAEYEKTIQQAFREVADLLSTRAMLRSQMASSLAGLQATGARLKMARARFQIGLGSYRDVLDAQRLLYAAQQSTTSLRREQQDAAAGLYKALGSGAEATTTVPLALAVNASPLSSRPAQ